MKHVLLMIVLAVGATAAAQAQTRIFRCGNTYTNNAEEAKVNGCKLMEGGNVTVVEGTRVSGSSAVKLASASPTAQPQPPQRIDADDQKARDADAKAILEAELKKAEARQAELVKEYNNGEPEKQGIEARNHQKYLDRVAELKASIARNESDIAGLKRELGRQTPR